MYNIHLMGDFKNLDQLIKDRTITDNAVQFKEGNSVKDIIQLGFKLTAPLLIIMIAFALWRFFHLDNDLAFSFKTVVLLIIATISTYLLTYVHEFIHALFYPRKARKEVWKMLDQGAFFTYSEAPTSKCRFIVLCLAPAFILGFIPYILWMLFADSWPMDLGLMILVISLAMTFGGAGDFVNVYNAWQQVPKNALVFNFGLHSYWIKDPNKPWII